MYTLLELESKTFGELKKIGRELNVLPEGDRRLRQTWIDAIAGVTLPLLQLLKVSSAVEVQVQERPIVETVETSPGVEVDRVHEAPLESKFGRIVYPRSVQKPIEQAAKTSPAEEVEQAQAPIEQAAKTSPAEEVDPLQDIINQTWTLWEKQYCAWLKDAKWCIYRGENKRIDAFLPVSKTLRLEGMNKGAEYCAIWEVSECIYDFNGLPLPVCSSLYTQESIELATKTSPGVKVEKSQESTIKLGDWVQVTRKPRLASGVKRGEIFQVLRVNSHDGKLVIENPHENPKYILSARLGFLDPSEVRLVPCNRLGRC